MMQLYRIDGWENYGVWLEELDHNQEGNEKYNYISFEQYESLKPQIPDWEEQEKEAKEMMNSSENPHLDDV